jgi:hypothetical protein
LLVGEAFDPFGELGVAHQPDLCAERRATGLDIDPPKDDRGQIRAFHADRFRKKEPERYLNASPGPPEQSLRAVWLEKRPRLVGAKPSQGRRKRLSDASLSTR